MVRTSPHVLIHSGGPDVCTYVWCAEVLLYISHCKFSYFYFYFYFTFHFFRWISQIDLWCWKNLLNYESPELGLVIWRKKKCLIFFFFCQKNKCFTSSILYGTRARGNVFKIEFRVFSREFESIETSPGFVQLQEENWN